MKKYILPVLLCGCLAFMSSCTDGFDEMNTTSTGITKSQVLPNSLLVRNMWKGISADYQRNYNLYDDLYAHYFADGTTWWSTDNYAYNDGWAKCGWEAFYTERQKEYLDVNDICGDKASYVNMKAINDVWNIILWLRLVDRWGDVPYKDSEGNYATAKATPIAFNSQKDIYEDMLARLDKDGSSITSADGQYDPAADDLIYGGNTNIAKWKKLAYSLMLRLAVRVSKVDASVAQTYAAKAIAGGVMTSNDDNARIQCDDSRWNDYYGRIVYDWQQASMSSDFMDVLTGSKSGYALGVQDPRLPLWFTPGGKGYAGIANGIDPSGSFFTTFKYSDYAEINIRTAKGFFYTNRDDITKSHLAYPLMDYSEVCFLQAEAALRGLISGDVETYYQNGISASIKTVAKTSGVDLASDAISNYLAAVPKTTSASSKEAKLRLICTQEWVALFPNSQEAWTLLRRTGYPDFLVYPQFINGSGLVSSGNWVQRLSYPNSEYENDADFIPSDYKSSSSKYAKREQYGLWWSLAGEGNTLAKGYTPNNF